EVAIAIGIDDLDAMVLKACRDKTLPEVADRGCSLDHRMGRRKEDCVVRVKSRHRGSLAPIKRAVKSFIGATRHALDVVRRVAHSVPPLHPSLALAAGVLSTSGLIDQVV